MNTWQEWRCLTDPTNSLSALRMLSCSNAPSGATIIWSSVPGHPYFVQRCTDLAAQPAFVTFTNITGQPAQTTVTDPAQTGTQPVFYRVAVP
jgi:hypothetical protein